MAPKPYTLMRPETQTTSVIFASPHSGRSYPKGLLRKTVLSERLLRSSEDAFVDRLFERVPEAGAPFLKAETPRAYVDFNRAADELDSALVEGAKRRPHNPRVASGLGVVPRVVAGGRSIYRGKISLDEANGRIADHWRPYHDRLHHLMTGTRAQFGKAILIDCHSMPHEAISGYASLGGRRAEVVLGDRFGAAAETDIVDRVEAIFVDAGLRVVRNAPFAGAYITQAYGRPSAGLNVVQVEIDRALYMDEAAIQPHDGFRSFRSLMIDVAWALADLGRDDMRLAAE